ncbi:MAG: methionyl-tRNA formyltransferase [Bacteroidetes bacterium]|nr:methionyl-tRNA formyltransferase [Bacteroidota bacterium]
MRLVFMGTPDFAVPSLRLLHHSGHDIAAVVTAPDRKRGRGQRVSPSPVKQYALTHGIPVTQPESLTDPAFVEQLRAFAADCFVIVAFRILPEDVFTIPPKGSFNLHASLLPKYRGAAPINWALMKGETESGVTTFFLRRKVDTGGMILQEAVRVHEDMTAGELHDVLADLGADVVRRTVELIEGGRAVPRPQDDSAATPAPKIFRETCAIPWEKSARDVHNHIRGLSPHPAAWTLHAGRQLQLLRSRLLEEDSAGTPGSVLDTSDGIRIQCGRGSIAILELKPEGRKGMKVEEYLRGYALSVGDVLVETTR